MKEEGNEGGIVRGMKKMNNGKEGRKGEGKEDWMEASKMGRKETTEGSNEWMEERGKRKEGMN